MGFFKKIGKAIKKNVSFKNLVKIGTPLLGAIPIAGGMAQSLVSNMSEQHEANKQARQQELAQRQAQEEYNASLSASKKQNPNIGEILIGGAGGALTGMGGVLAGSQAVGQIGATAVTNTTNTWLKQNWLKLVGGILGTVTVVFVFVKMLGGRKTPYRRR